MLTFPLALGLPLASIIISFISVSAIIHLPSLATVVFVLALMTAAVLGAIFMPLKMSRYLSLLVRSLMVFPLALTIFFMVSAILIGLTDRTN